MSSMSAFAATFLFLAAGMAAGMREHDVAVELLLAALFQQAVAYSNERARSGP